MELIDLKNKTAEELSQLLGELRAKMVKLRFDLADKKLKNFSDVGKTRKAVARVLTELKLKSNR